MAKLSKNGKPIGRPKGSRTRPDAPSKIIAPPRDRKGHFIHDPQYRENLKKVVRRAGPSQQSIPIATPLAETSIDHVDTRPDTDLFGPMPAPPKENASRISTAGGPDNAEFPPEIDPDAKSETPPQTPEDQRALCEGIFDGSVNLLAGFMGPWWLPRPIGNDPTKGQVQHDEKQAVVRPMMECFSYWGIQILTPPQKMYLAIAQYIMPRLRLVMEWCRLTFMKKATPPPGQPQPAPAPPRPEKKEAAEPAPETEKPQANNTPFEVEFED